MGRTVGVGVAGSFRNYITVTGIIYKFNKIHNSNFAGQ